MPEPNPKSIAFRIRATRKSRGFSQAELGRKLGIKQSNIGRWEQGQHNPRPSTLRRIADALGVNLNWLLTGEGMMERNPVRAIGVPLEPLFKPMRDLGKLIPEGMRDIAIRIRKMRKALGMSQTKLARQLGINPSLISLWETAKRDIAPEYIEKLAAVLNVTPRWLCTGEGEMKLSEQEQLIEKLKRGEIPSKELTPAPIRWIPILGVVPGGNPFAPEVVPLGNVAVAADAIRHPGAFALQVRGNSMAPAVQDGDQVACEPYEGEHLAPGAMVVALVGGETALKFYVRRGDQHLLISADSSIPPIVLAEGDLILARAVSVIKTL